MPPSTRTVPSERDPSLNRSLERGIDILRAFGPGATLLTNSDLVERTGLPKATFSPSSHSAESASLLSAIR